MTRLAMLYHPDKGGQPEQMIRVNAAYERALRERPRYTAARVGRSLTPPAPQA